MESINTGGATVHFGEAGIHSLQDQLRSQDFSSIFILVDSNTEKHCLPRFLEWFPEATSVKPIRIPAGEEHKHLQSCELVWRALSEQGADRNSLLINLGGGVVCDLGGFVAATFKRGIAFINIPTTLLAMVDASVGGKTGVDFDGLKNQIGVIQDPELVTVWPEFLQTLPKREVFSGFAEMLKHGLIQDADYWKQLKQADPAGNFAEYITTSVAIKAAVVKEDPKEKGLRKILNYGHTLGHAVESYFLASHDLPTLLHGEAIAIGMIMEAYLSRQLCDLPQSSLEDITRTIHRFFPKVDIPEASWAAIIRLLEFDKKNSHGKIQFVLLSEIANPQTDRQVPASLLRESFAYYKDS